MSSNDMSSNKNPDVINIDLMFLENLRTGIDIVDEDPVYSRFHFNSVSCHVSYPSILPICLCRSRIRYLSPAPRDSTCFTLGDVNCYPVLGSEVVYLVYHHPCPSLLSVSFTSLLPGRSDQRTKGR